MQIIFLQTRFNDLRRVIYLLTQYAKPYWKTFFVLLVVSLFTTLLAALPPLIMAPILDIALGNPLILAGAEKTSISLSELDLSNLGTMVFQWLGMTAGADRFRLVTILCGVYVLVGLGKGLAEFASYLLALRIRVYTARALQGDLFKHIINQPLSFFSQQRTGELMSRLEQDTNATTASFETVVVRLITAPLLIVFYGILLLRTSPNLGIAVVIAVILHYSISRGIRNPIRRTMGGQFTALAELSARLQETLSNIRIVKSFGAERFELSKLKQQIQQVIQVQMRFGVYKHVEEPARSFVHHFIEAGVLLIAIAELLSGQLTASTFFLFIYVGRAVMVPIATLASTLIAVQTTLAASERLFELFAIQSNIKDGEKPITQFEQDIRFENVSFAYEESPTLQQINLEIQKGEVVALVGPSGAGKSTLVDMVLRFYDPAVGTILLDGQDLRQLRLEQYRQLFGVVSQESLLFNATISENIAYNRADLDQDSLVTAAKIANAHLFIQEMPQGYDTLIGDRGVRLSGGQRQRLAIARAVAANPQVLILDEATSALDSESERQVQEAIDRVIQQTTAIVIAHRLSTILHADKIVVLDEGRIIDQGRHFELLERCALYRHVFELQFSPDVLSTPSIAPELNGADTHPIPDKGQTQNA